MESRIYRNVDGAELSTFTRKNSRLEKMRVRSMRNLMQIKNDVMFSLMCGIKFQMGGTLVFRWDFVEFSMFIIF